MALTPGTRLGVYEVTAQIGEGGMGQVYRATDTKLKRQVAIKILPTSLAADHDRLARFQREAEVLASLNHPHIAAIYGLEDADGVKALVMELVEGEDLSQRIARGAIPLDEALPIAKQIAEALEAAHEQGIIHRDLKPANIKVRSDGTVKVLDFGLAKSMEPTGAMSPNVSQSPTITTPAMTQAGMILGTAAYMSPEQAKGGTMDKRSDVWAFGAVLYEMFTGRRAFEGDDVSDTLARILMKEPDWTALPATVPPAVVTVLRRCLQKDRKQRVRDLGDVSLALEGAFETTAPQTMTTSSASRGRLVWMAAFAVAAVLAAALAIPTVRHLRETPPPETRTEIVTPATDQPTSFALSPDGRQIVFVASVEGGSRLWLRSLATTTAQPLAGTEGATFPFWAPDGRSLGFFAGRQLKRLDLRGGVPQTLAPVTSTSASVQGQGTWNADGVIVFAPSGIIGTSLMRVSATGGAATEVTTLGPQQQAHQQPYFLPDGRRFLFYARGAPDAAGIYLGALDGSAPTRLTPADSPGWYLPSGWLVWGRAGTLVAQRLDVAKAALTGEPVTVAEGVAGVSVAATGVLAFRTSTPGGTDSQLLWFDRQGKQRGQIGPPAPYGNIQLSPDGKLVVVDYLGHLWSADPARGVFSRVNPGEIPDSAGNAVSPDGRVAFTYTIGGAPGDIYVRLASGAGTAELLVKSATVKHPNHWSLDGRFLIYDDHTAPNQDLWIVPMTGDRKPIPFLVTPADETDANFSPDTRWIAYSSDESGRREVYVQGFVADHIPAAGIGKWRISAAGGAKPRWGRDGKELYYMASDRKLMAVPVKFTATTFEVGDAVPLFATRTRGFFPYDVAPDGRFLLNTVTEAATANSSPITLVLNWTAGLKR